MPPALGIAARLLAAGHKVSILGENSMQEEVRQAGCRFLAYRYAPNRPDRQPASDPFPDWAGQSPFQVLHKLLYAHAAAYARDVIEVCRETPIDRVIADGFLLGGMIGAEAAQKPFWVEWPAIDPVPHPGRPPDGLGLQPGTNVFSKTRNQILNTVFRGLLQSGKKLINELRAAYQLPALHHPFEQYQKAEKVLLLTSRHFDYPTHLPANTYYTGPLTRDPGWARKSTLELAQPYVLVSLGSTFQDQQALYQRLIDSLSKLPVPAVVTLGNVFEPSDFTASPQITILKNAAHAALLPQCGLVVHHGGHGIVMKSILAGLPQLVIPLGRDQLGNAARIVYHHLGLKASKNARPQDLLPMMKQLLADESYGRNAHRMAEKINKEMAQNLVLQLLD